MKKLKESWCPKGMKQELTSYHLKSILFWECENHPYDHEWTHDQLATRIVSMCYLLVSYIQRGILPFVLDTDNLEDFVGNPISYVLLDGVLPCPCCQTN
jgi:hypothetical protein